MWTWIKQRLELRSLTGVEIRQGKDGPESVSACTLKLSGDLLTVESKQQGFKSVTHFSKHFKPCPVALSITGRGLLTKEITGGVLPDKQMLQLVMPNANADDFYIQIVYEENKSMVSLIRKTTADKAIIQLRDMGYQVVAISLGSWDDDPSYAIAFKTLLMQDISEVVDLQFTNTRKQVFAKARVTGLALIGGTFLFVLLLLSFLLTGYYAEKADELTAKADASGLEITKFRSIETNVAEEKQLITSVGWTGGYSLAWLTGRLMLTKPDRITLRYFSINPLSEIKSTGLSSDEAYEAKKVIVKGFCDEASTLNNWLYHMRSEIFVASCVLGHYELNKDNGQASFTIHITLKDYEG